MIALLIYSSELDVGLGDGSVEQNSVGVSIPEQVQLLGSEFVERERCGHETGQFLQRLAVHDAVVMDYEKPVADLLDERR
jgi:hypothetical protein